MFSYSVHTMLTCKRPLIRCTSEYEKEIGMHVEKTTLTPMRPLKCYAVLSEGVQKTEGLDEDYVPAGEWG